MMTNLQAKSVEKSGAPLVERVLYRIGGPPMAQDVIMGVLPQLHASTAPEAEGGFFYGPKTFRMRGYPCEQHATNAENDASARKRLWELSEKLTGIRYL